MPDLTEADTFALAEQYRSLATSSLACWLELLRDNDGSQRMRNRLCAMITIEATPDAAPDRDVLYEQLLSFFDDHGYIPEFSLGKR